MQETRLCRTETRSWEGCQEFHEGCLRAWQLTVESLNASKIAPESLSLCHGFFFPGSFLGNRNLRGRQTTKCLRTASSCATVVPHLMWCHTTFLQALHHNFCNHREWKWNRPFTRAIFCRVAQKWSWNETGVVMEVSHFSFYRCLLSIRRDKWYNSEHCTYTSCSLQ